MGDSEETQGDSELKEIKVKVEEDETSLRKTLSDKEAVQQLNQEMAELHTREIKRNAEIQYLHSRIEKSKAQDTPEHSLEQESELQSNENPMYSALILSLIHI
eukprot:TRINITY_DN18505_c0_g1_i3.p1 TRINITY_DN18505_c0_g1~~TRINITY_DN18505_c0_g1_i3.p1  ORF type:complete len:103 (-),score=24.50 TRINITY_DN18505_c0_g1_i3:88-396(-)